MRDGRAVLRTEMVDYDKFLSLSDERKLKLDRSGSKAVNFNHPAARGAKIWTTKLKSGETKQILVVVTNAELNRDKKRYNGDVIEKLIVAIEEFISDSGDIDGYLLANRLRDWENAKDR